uniref:Spermatogenesis-defective protein 39 homolog n=1 Tax=Sinocyclocheilus grahami TaxID=75366 RepID=A0A672RFX3_SINGR
MSRAKPEDDEYWNSSKFKAFTFDDEDDEFSRLKESKRTVNSILVDEEDEDEDDVERVSWSGESVGSISWSVKETASSIRSGSEQSFPKIDRTPSLSKQGSGYSLSSLFKEKFRSLQDKLLLLDEAVAIYDGNLITAVIKYFLESLFFFFAEILFRELMARDVALRHYVHYLKEMGEQKLLVELLKALGRTEDMALMQYKEHLNIKDEGRRRDFLKSCLGLPFSQDDATHVQDHYTLLERQIIVYTLRFQTFKYSPSNIRKTFRISEKQYILTALGARAKLKSWFDVDSLFNTKNWLGYTKKRSPIGFHRVVDILQKNSAPVNVLQEYVNLIDDPELKLSVALKYKCHDIVINVSSSSKCFSVFLSVHHCVCLFCSFRHTET